MGNRAGQARGERKGQVSWSIRKPLTWQRDLAGSGVTLLRTFVHEEITKAAAEVKETGKPVAFVVHIEP